MPKSSTSACAISVVLKLTRSASVTTGFENWSSSRPGETCTKIATIGSTRKRERDGRRSEVDDGEQRSAHARLDRVFGIGRNP